MFNEQSNEEHKTESLLDKRILIVDDQSYNIDAALVIMNTAMKLDTEKLCSLAYNGREALNKVIQSTHEFKLKKCGFDLILMDCNMPFMDGYEATTEIRRYLYKNKLRQPVIVALTGHTEPNYIKLAKESGMNMVLSKPLSPELLKKVIKTLKL
jgi:CheY-like chemotaxis protein